MCFVCLFSGFQIPICFCWFIYGCLRFQQTMQNKPWWTCLSCLASSVGLPSEVQQLCSFNGINWLVSCHARQRLGFTCRVIFFCVMPRHIFFVSRRVKMLTYCDHLELLFFLRIWNYWINFELFSSGYWTYYYQDLVPGSWYQVLGTTRNLCTRSLYQVWVMPWIFCVIRCQCVVCQ